MWSPIIEDDLVAYSTHWDIRPIHFMEPPYARMLVYSFNFAKTESGDYDVYDSKDFRCKYLFADGRSREVKGTVRTGGGLPGGEGAFYILCPAKGIATSAQDAPDSVSILCKGCEAHWTHEVGGRGLGWHKDALSSAFTSLVIFFICPFGRQIWGREGLERLFNKEDPPKRGELAVCVRSAFGPLDQPLRMAQFLMYYTAAGAGQFTFYNSRGMAPRTLKVLGAAQRLGMPVEVLPWNAFESWGRHRVAEYNQYMAINACLYWNMHRFRHVAVVDIDEFIVDRGGGAGGATPSLLSLLARLEAREPGASAYAFLHSFAFPLAAPADGKADRLARAFEILRPARAAAPLANGDRGKMILRTDAVVSAMVHMAGETVRDVWPTVVPVEDAQLLHFRGGAPEGGGEGLRASTELLGFRERIAAHPLVDSLLDAAGVPREAEGA
jgi:hypothetical protein